jgi:uncharacterized FlaG/YvyC family protein
MAESAKNTDVNEAVEEVKEEVQEAGGEAAAKSADEVKAEAAKAKSSASKTINEAIKQVESFTENIGKALGGALQDRANVVMVRVNDESLAYLDMLVDADITKSRSESAAFLINEGIKANEGLFGKIREITDQIAALRAQLRETVQVEE